MVANAIVFPVVINETVMAHLVELSPICPLHQPRPICGQRAANDDTKLVHIAAFDTAGFHYHRPEIWSGYALPKSLRDQGVRCYGFRVYRIRRLCANLKPISQILPKTLNHRAFG